MRVHVTDHTELADLVLAYREGAPVDINPVMDRLTVRQSPATEAKTLAAVVAVMAVVVGLGIFAASLLMP